MLPAQCWPEGFTHDTRPEAMWLSCTPTNNPNPERGASLWLLYDLGAEYSLSNSIVWNYNEPGMEAFGVTRLAIDYSIDGQGWTDWGEHTLPLASGRRDYSGTEGPDLNGVKARYLLLTVLATGNGNSPDCAGLAEVRFNLDATVPTNQWEEDVQLAITPNPTAGAVEVSLPGENLSSIGVYDQAGRLLHQQAASGASNTVDLAGVPAGVYTLRIREVGGAIYQRRVVKM